MNLALKAMEFACNAHKSQVRKYTSEPYEVHLAQVAGLASTALFRWVDEMPTFGVRDVVCVAWLHDCIEDCGVGYLDLVARFGGEIANAVVDLSDLETGNRATRKDLARDRLAKAPGWVQTIKAADIISNAQSILVHDLKFAKVFAGESLHLLDVLDRAEPDLRMKAWKLLEGRA